MLSTLFINCSTNTLKTLSERQTQLESDVVDVIALAYRHINRLFLDDRQNSWLYILIDISNETTSVVVLNHFFKSLPIGFKQHNKRFGFGTSNFL